MLETIEKGNCGFCGHFAPQNGETISPENLHLIVGVCGKPLVGDNETQIGAGWSPRRSLEAQACGKLIKDYIRKGLTCFEKTRIIDPVTNN